MDGLKLVEYAVCANCYDGKIVCQKIDELVVFFCDVCLKEVVIPVYKIETFI